MLFTTAAIFSARACIPISAGNARRAQRTTVRPGTGSAGRLLLLCCLVSGCNSFNGHYLRSSHGIVIADSEAGRLEEAPLVMPATAPSISQGFMPAPRVRYKRDNVAIHNGIDIISARGTAVYPVADGVVTASRFEPLYGHQVEVEHGIAANGRRFRSRYFHLRKRLVRAGDRVSTRKPLGELGSSGLMATFPHLHLELAEQAPGKVDWHPSNPHRHWLDGPGRVSCWRPVAADRDGTFRIRYPLDCLGGTPRQAGSSD